MLLRQPILSRSELAVFLEEAYTRRLSARAVGQKLGVSFRRLSEVRLELGLPARASEYGFYNASDLAELWGVTPQVVARWCRAGKLKGKNPYGNEWWIEPDEAREFAWLSGYPDPLTGETAAVIAWRYELELSLDHPLARNDLVYRYGLHRTLMRADPKRRMLYRLDGRTLRVQSVEKLDWDQILKPFPNYARIRAETFDPRLNTQAVRNFRLLANPVVTRDGKRYPLTDPEDVRGWLIRQGQRLGFQPLEFEAEFHGILTFRKPNGRIVTYYAWDYRGRLRVTERTTFLKARLEGIGPGKFAGLGYLEVLP